VIIIGAAALLTLLEVDPVADNLPEVGLAIEYIDVVAEVDRAVMAEFTLELLEVDPVADNLLEVGLTIEYIDVVVEVDGAVLAELTTPPAVIVTTTPFSSEPIVLNDIVEEAELMVPISILFRIVATVVSEHVPDSEFVI